MTRISILCGAALAALTFVSAPSFAGDIKGTCVAVVGADDTNPPAITPESVEPGCQCVADAVAADPSLEANVSEVLTHPKFADRRAAMNDASVAVLNKCWPS